MPESPKRPDITVSLRIECELCGGEFTVEVGKEDYDRYRATSVLCQDAFPYLTEDERELIISQTCGPCWERLWEDEPDEE